MKAGLTFATALRSILRSDPDVIMVGEIRDAETAKIAIESALTGHFVLSTLHTNDAPGALTRLNEMGVEPFLTGSAVIGRARPAARAQALRELLRDVHADDGGAAGGARLARRWRPRREGMALYRKVGCPRCNRTGYKGRIGIFQLLIMNDEIESLAAHERAAATRSSAPRSAGRDALALGRRHRQGRRRPDLDRRARPRPRLTTTAARSERALVFLEHKLPLPRVPCWSRPVGRACAQEHKRAARPGENVRYWA